MKDYYEDLWTRLPAGLDPPDWEVRRRFLLEGIRPGERVLDLGSGAGDFTAEISRAGAKPAGVEVAEAAIARARSRYPELDFRLAPIEGPLPARDCEFDAVWSSEVIEHVADTARWLSEIRRVLRPGGRVRLTTPSHGRVRLALAGVEPFSEPLGDHLHLYTRRSLEQVLGEFGFDGISVQTAAGPPLLRRLLLARAQR